MLPGPRVPPLPESEWPPEIEEILRPFRGFTGGRVFNIFSTLARHPELFRSWLVFANHVLARSTLPPRERELAILRVGWLCRSDYEWGQHVLIARGVGLSDEEIARVPAGPDAPGWQPREAAVLRAADELRRDACVSDPTWAELVRHFETRQLLDLVFAIGQYTLVAMALNTLGVERDPGVPPLPGPSPARRASLG